MSIETILGRVSPNSLGFTLPHEHIKVHVPSFYTKGPSFVEPIFAENRINLENVGLIKQYPWSSKYNLNYGDEDSARAVYKDLVKFKEAGGGTIVENSPGPSIKRDVDFMKKISKELGIKIVGGTGFYVDKSHDNETKEKIGENMYNIMLKELTVGCDDDISFKAGFIGEIGSSWPITDFEKRAIRASGELQSQLHCGVTFHPGRACEAPFEIMRIFQEAGGKADKTVMSHLCRTVPITKILDFAELGTYCQYDLFGTEASLYQLEPTLDMPNDAQRIRMMKVLLDEGKCDRLLMSQDIYGKHRLSAFGGHGFTHIINTVIPMMKNRGFTDEDIRVITVKSPAEWLTLNY